MTTSRWIIFCLSVRVFYSINTLYLSAHVTMHFLMVQISILWRNYCDAVLVREWNLKIWFYQTSWQGSTYYLEWFGQLMIWVLAFCQSELRSCGFFLFLWGFAKSGNNWWHEYVNEFMECTRGVDWFHSPRWKVIFSARFLWGVFSLKNIFSRNISFPNLLWW